MTSHPFFLPPMFHNNTTHALQKCENELINGNGAKVSLASASISIVNKFMVSHSALASGLDTSPVELSSINYWDLARLLQCLIIRKPEHWPDNELISLS